MDRYRKYSNEYNLFKRSLIYSIPITLTSKNVKNQAPAGLPVTPVPPTIHQFKRINKNFCGVTSSRLKTSNRGKRQSEILLKSSPGILSNMPNSPIISVAKSRPTTAKYSLNRKLVSHRLNKTRELNIDTLLMNKTALSCEKLIQEYLRRQGLPETTKLFILKGPFEYVRRCLLKRGWVENHNPNSIAYHLKWTYNDTEQDYNTLRSPQAFNHIPKNRELTTKDGLCKNMRHCPKFFPRCYDVGDKTQLKDLMADYEQICVINMLRAHARHFSQGGRLIPCLLYRSPSPRDS